MGSKPTREDETPSARINWKLFLLVAGIIGIVLVAFALFPSGEKDSVSADVNNPDAIGQGIKPDNLPVVETETEDTDVSKLSLEEQLYFGHSGSCNAWYEIGNIPDAILLRSPDTNGMENIYISNVKIEGRTIEFFVINPYKDSKRIERLSLGYILVGEKDDERIEIKTYFMPQTIPPKSKVAFSSDSSEMHRCSVKVPLNHHYSYIQ